MCPPRPYLRTASKATFRKSRPRKGLPHVGYVRADHADEPVYAFQHCRNQETPELAVYWEGFVFMPGHVAVRASIQQLVAAINPHSLLEAASRLMDNFVLVHAKGHGRVLPFPR
jgi:hypothetical protein